MKRIKAHFVKYHHKYVQLATVMVIASFLTVYLEMHGLGTGLGIVGTVLIMLSDVA